MRRLYRMLLPVLLLLPLRATAAEPFLTSAERDWIARNPVVHVLFIKWPPFQFPSGEPSGICRDYLEVIAEKTGLRFVYHLEDISPDEVMTRLRSGSLQCDLLPALRQNDEREQYLHFTKSYLNLAHMVFTRKPYRYVHGLDDLKDETIVVPKGSSVHRRLVRDYPDMHFMLTNAPAEALEAVAAGKADAYVGSLTVGTWIMGQRELSNLKVAAPTPYNDDGMGMAVRRDLPELASILEKGLAAISSEKRKAILNKWMTVPYRSGVDIMKAVRWGSLILMPVLGLLALLVVWNRRLKHEIAKQRTMETMLRDNEEALRRVVEGIRAAVFTVDPANQKILDVNSEGERLFGYSREELLGKTCQFLCGHDAGTVIQEACPLLDGNIHLGEFLVQRKDGFRVPVMKTVVSSRRDSKAVFLEILIDISEKKRAERDSLQAQKLESIGRLAAGVAHELNTPAQFVSDNIRFLEEELTPFMEVVHELHSLFCPDPTKASEVALERARELCPQSQIAFLSVEVPQALAETQEGVQRITQIVQSMKAFAHPDEVSPIPLNVAEAVGNTVIVARNEWKYVASVDVDMPEDLPAIMVVPGLFNQVILNLLINAVDALRDKYQDTGELGSIRIEGGRHENMVEIRITDNADGIPASVRDHVFDPFYTTKPVGKGTGQGLAIAYSVIVDKAGGELFLKTEEGVGTTFYIRLPATS